MLKVPDLDHASYGELFEHARSRAAALSGEWTDFNYHDPGVTTLSVFAWLTDSLNYYINAVGEVHRLKYLKLLGIRPVCRASRCVASFSGEGACVLPRGGRLRAGNVVFELEQTRSMSFNRLTKLYVERGGSVSDLTGLAGIEGARAPLFWPGRLDEAVYFGFERPLAGEVEFFVEAGAQGGRNPFGSGFSLARLVWESYGGGAWRPVETLVDETGGFLRDGFLRLRLPCGTDLLQNPLLEGAHYLRCRAVRNDYDETPRLGRVLCNCVPVVQKETRLCAVEAVYDGSGAVVPDWCFSEGERAVIAVQSGEDYVLWQDIEEEAGALPWQRRLRFAGAAPKAGARLLILTGAAGEESAARLGRTDGCAGQRLACAVPDVYDLRLALMWREGEKIRLQLWERAEDFSGASWDDRVFVYDRAEREIVFGDGVHGMQPAQGRMAVVVAASSTAFEGGNVLAGQLTEALFDSGTPLRVSNPLASAGGERPRNAAELEEQVEERLTRLSRAVTAGDYHKLTLATPGLMIDCVNVITAREYEEAYGTHVGAGTVLVAVKPKGTSPRPQLSGHYRRLIREHLERFRLLTTEIRVEPVRYLRVNAYGRIRLGEGESAQAKARVEECLRGFLDGAAQGAFGRGIVYGRVFAALELLEGVRSVEQLTLEPAGEGGRRNEHGDIVVYPDALSYAGESSFEWI